MLYAYPKNAAADLTPRQISQLGKIVKEEFGNGRDFEELLDSVREAGSILRGEKEPTRRVAIGASGVRTIRERTRLSQSEFARLIGVSVKTLQNCEQDRRIRTGRRPLEDPCARAALGRQSHSPDIAVGLYVEVLHRS